MDDFEKALLDCRSAVERYVRFRIASRFDSDDVLQEVYTSAYKNFNSLRDKEHFKTWIISIARNKCTDYFRAKAKQLEVPLEEIAETRLTYGRFGLAETDLVSETLDKLGPTEKQILYMYYFQAMPQSEIARLTGVPVGTVKSRLHNARNSFRKNYPHHLQQKGEMTMNKLPKLLPDYKITISDKPPFAVKWEELMGWFIVPRSGEKLSWAIYNIPERIRREHFELEVGGMAEVHGLQGVEILSKEYSPNISEPPSERRFIAQLTDTHCRILAESHCHDGVKKFYTFLDGDAFLKNWGFGPDNCGNEICIFPKHDIKRNGNVITHVEKPFLLDTVGRYCVNIAGRDYDTVCVMDIASYNEGIITEQYLDKNGRTILWRRFNRDDWAFGRYKQKWSDKLPENERLTVNGQTYVHWYDCITDYIL